MDHNFSDDKEYNSEVGICRFDYKIFEEKGCGGVQEQINGFPYFNILFCCGLGIGRR